MSALQVFIGHTRPVLAGVAGARIVLGQLAYRKRLGLYGQLYRHRRRPRRRVHLPVLAVHGDLSRPFIAPFDPLEQVAVMKDALPGRGRAGIRRLSISAATSWRATCSAAWSMAAASC
jgi:hypothetical protein